MNKKQTKIADKYIVSEQPLAKREIHAFETLELRNSWLKDKNMDDWVPDTIPVMDSFYRESSWVDCLTEKSHLSPHNTVWITHTIEAAYGLIFIRGNIETIINNNNNGSCIIRKESKPMYISKCIYHEIEKE